MAPIPEFFDGYHLPDAEYECTYEEIESRFLTTPDRIKVWNLFKALLYRLGTLGVIPDAILVDGSFVTGRQQPGDVDVCVLLPPEKLRDAFSRLTDDHDKSGLVALFDPNNQLAIRNLFGAHLLLARNEIDFQQWSYIFRKGLNGNLRDPDPQRDPDWVRRPAGKGILKVVYPTTTDTGRGDNDV